MNYLIIELCECLFNAFTCTIVNFGLDGLVTVNSLISGKLIFALNEKKIKYSAQASKEKFSISFSRTQENISN